MSTVSTALDALWTNLEDDELKIVQPLGDAYFSSIIANPDPANVVAQSLALETAVVAALPNLEAAAAKDVATSLKALMDLEASTVLGAPSVATTSPPVAS